MVGETFGTIFGGGGFIIQPALLAAKIPANSAVANDIAAAACASLTFLFFSRKEKKQLKFSQFKTIFFWMGPPLVIGAFVGGYVLHLIPEGTLKWVVITICSIGLLYMLRKTFKESHNTYKPREGFIRYWQFIAVLAGLSIGFYDGVSAAGSGIICIIIITFIFQKDMKTTLIVANMLSLVSLSSASIVLLFVGLLSFELLSVMIPACLISGFIGARIVSIVPEKILRSVYMLIVFSLLLYMLNDMIV